MAKVSLLNGSFYDLTFSQLKLVNGDFIEGSGTVLAVVTVANAASLTDLRYAVFQGFDLSTATLVSQGLGETTDGSGELEIDLTNDNVNIGTDVVVVIVDFSTTPVPTSDAAVCYTVTTQGA